MATNNNFEMKFYDVSPRGIIWPLYLIVPVFAWQQEKWNNLWKVKNVDVLYLLLPVVLLLFVLRKVFIPYVIINEESIKCFEWFRYKRVLFSEVQTYEITERKITIKITDNKGTLSIWYDDFSPHKKALFLKTLKNKIGNYSNPHLAQA